MWLSMKALPGSLLGLVDPSGPLVPGHNQTHQTQVTDGTSESDQWWRQAAPDILSTAEGVPTELHLAGMMPKADRVAHSKVVHGELCVVTSELDVGG